MLIPGSGACLGEACAEVARPFRAAAGWLSGADRRLIANAERLSAAASALSDADEFSGGAARAFGGADEPSGDADRTSGGADERSVGLIFGAESDRPERGASVGSRAQSQLPQ